MILDGWWLFEWFKLLLNRNVWNVRFKPIFFSWCLTFPRYIENREEKRDQMISYFRKRLSNKWENCESKSYLRTLCFRYTNYFVGFIFCEFLNFAVVVSHFFLTDLFLNRRYRGFGFKIIEFYSLSFQKQRVKIVVSNN